MKCQKYVLGLWLAATVLGTLSIGDLSAQQPNTQAEDREIFQFLLANNDKINREVTRLDNGVETLTESSDPAVAKKIQEHVAAMYHRVKNGRPIRQRDPVFRAIFQHAESIYMELEKTDNGIRVIETSDDPFVTKLIQAHADVVSGFVKYGFAESRKNHPLPKR